MSPFRGWIIHWNMAVCVWVYKTRYQPNCHLSRSPLPVSRHIASKITWQQWTQSCPPPASTLTWQLAVFSGSGDGLPGPEKVSPPVPWKIPACREIRDGDFRLPFPRTTAEGLFNLYGTNILVETETGSLNLRWITKPTTLQICSHTFKTILNALLMRVSGGTLHI